MNRLEKKCVILSAGLHLLLLLLVVIGPGLMPSPTPRPESYPVLEFVPVRTTDLPISGGGNPIATPPPPTPTPPTPRPEVRPEPAPRETRPAQPPPRTTPTERARSPIPDVVEAKTNRRLPEINTNVVTLRTAARSTPSRSEADAARAQAQARAEARARAGLVAGAANALRQGQSSTTSVVLAGPGGGVPYANFNQAVFSAYDNAWERPASIAGDTAVTKAAVTIDRDGTVINAQISVPSGDADMDASVRRTLLRVKFVAPLPPESKESQRTVTVVFDLKSKRNSG